MVKLIIPSVLIVCTCIQEIFTILISINYVFQPFLSTFLKFQLLQNAINPTSLSFTLKHKEKYAYPLL